MSIGRQPPSEQVIDPRATEFTGWQTDPMNDDQLGKHAGRSDIKMRRQDLSDTGQEAGRRLDFQGRLHAATDDATLSVLWRELQLAQQRFITRVVAYLTQIVVDLEKCQTAVPLQVGTLQPVQRPILF